MNPGGTEAGGSDIRAERSDAGAEQPGSVAQRPDFGDRTVAQGLIRAIRRDVEALGRPVTLMEVCGTHTVAISRSGIRDLLSGYVDLRSGPGCPVCVTDQSDIDRMTAMARLPRTTVLTYGDMLRVPGDLGTLEQARAAGADVRVLYSALDGVALAAAQPERRFVFLGVGFETTAPGAALAVREAARLGLRNFLVFSAHKTLPPALRVLLEPARSAAGEEAERRAKVEGFILPGHVSAVIGRRVYDFIADDYGVPGAISGFEPTDILLAVRDLVGAVRSGRIAVRNLYPRVVREEGNPKAREVIAEVFEPADTTWRGLGLIPGSGLGLRSPYHSFDANRVLGDELELEDEPRAAVSPGDARRRACRCGAVLRGEIVPPQCPLFAKVCIPADPAGPCMVSSEGSCAAYYRYESRRWTS